jgi:C4-dicarboxylate-specific signal transduction histidine kinase
VLSFFLTRRGSLETGLVNGLISASAILATTYLALKIKSAEAATLEARAQLAHIGRVTTLGELTASIAHEVNQPLAAVVTNANACSRWLAAQPPNLEEVRQAVERIVKDANRASQVVERVRGLARREPPQKDWLNVNEIILEVIALTQSEVQRDRISLRALLADNLPPVLVDRIQLQQVVLNLTLNAIESMMRVSEGSRELLVTSSQDNVGAVVVSLRDSGSGLDPKEVEHLFDPFHTTKVGGMGMGLAISRSIIEEHGGRIWATPGSPRGAVFQFALPNRATGVAVIEIANGPR